MRRKVNEVLGEKLEANGEGSVLTIVVHVGVIDGDPVGAEPQAHVDVQSAVLGGVVPWQRLDQNVLDVFAFLPLAGGVEAFCHLVVPVQTVAGPLHRIGVDEHFPIFLEATRHLEEEADLNLVPTVVPIGLVQTNRDQASFAAKVNVDPLPMRSRQLRAFEEAYALYATCSFWLLGRDQPHVVVRSLQNVELLPNTASNVA